MVLWSWTAMLNLTSPSGSFSPHKSVSMSCCLISLLCWTCWGAETVVKPWMNYTVEAYTHCNKTLSIFSQSPHNLRMDVRQSLQSCKTKIVGSKRPHITIASLKDVIVQVLFKINKDWNFWHKNALNSAAMSAIPVLYWSSHQGRRQIHRIIL